jgi:pyridoxamine 5'-phosphate oxidase family protein
MQSQRLGRLATVSPEGKPQNAPVTFRYNADSDTIDIGGMNMSQSKKFRNILKNPHVAFVIDEVIPPWKPRGVEIRGLAQAIDAGGKAIFGDSYTGDDAIIRITAEQIIGWGIDNLDPYQSNNRKVT